MLCVGLAFAILKQPSLPTPPPTYWNPPVEVEPPTPPAPPTITKVEPEWQEYKPVRTADASLGKVLGDIESHMPPGHIYRDSDKVTWGHETTHGINSNLRQKFRSDKRINGFYCLQDRAAIIEEPKVLITQVASEVPPSLRGGVYQLYLVSQASSWNADSLYLLDEFVAYTNGSACRKDLGIKERAETVQFMFEFNVYCTTLAKVIKDRDANYDDKQFKAFLMWNIERSMEIYAGEEGATTYWKKFQNHQDAAELRQFANDYFGETWCDRVLWANLPTSTT